MDAKELKAGDTVSCWYPDFSKRPWRAEVVSTRVRRYGGKVDGMLVTVKNRQPCKRCVSFGLEGVVTLGEEWFSASYARASRRTKRKRT